MLPSCFLSYLPSLLFSPSFLTFLRTYFVFCCLSYPVSFPILHFILFAPLSFFPAFLFSYLLFSKSLSLFLQLHSFLLDLPYISFSHVPPFSSLLFISLILFFPLYLHSRPFHSIFLSLHSHIFSFLLPFQNSVPFSLLFLTSTSSLSRSLGSPFSPQRPSLPAYYRTTTYPCVTLSLVRVTDLA